MRWSQPLRSWPLPSIHTWVTSPGMAAVWLLELVRGAEGVAGAGHEQARHLEGGQVLDAQPVGPAGRVQRVADQHQAGGGQPVGDGHRADAPAHRAAAEQDPVRRHGRLVGERAGLLHHAREELGRTVGGLAPLAAVGEVAAPHRERRQRLLDGDEARAAATSCRRPGNSRAAPGLRRARGSRCASRMRRASVRSAIRWAASSVSPPWSGWAARSRSRNWRCTSCRCGTAARRSRRRARARRGPTAPGRGTRRWTSRGRGRGRTGG